MMRTLSASSLFLTVTALFVAVPGCNTSSNLQQPQQGQEEDTGGTSSANSSSSTGGTSSSSTTSSTSTSTNTSSGGATSTNPSTGGTSSANPQGGNSPTGGRNQTGGKPATGGKSSANPTGGSVGTDTGGAGVTTGGASVGTDTGGSVSTGTGGTTTVSTGTGNTGKTVTFSTSGKAIGAMTGYAFVAMGATDTVSEPTCGATKAAITSASGCSNGTNWPTAGVCVTGSVPTNPSPYESWGINIGASSTEPAGSGLGQEFTKVAIAATGAPTGATFRYIISVGKKDYCAAATIGTAVAFSTFNTQCYNSPPDGTAYTGTGADITGVQLQIVPGTATITVTNLCLTGITFS